MATAKKKAAKPKAAEKSKDESKSTTESDDDQSTTEVPEYQPRQLKLENEGFDHHAFEEQRQAELAAEREVHNRRTGDASR